MITTIKTKGEKGSLKTSVKLSELIPVITGKKLPCSLDLGHTRKAKIEKHGQVVTIEGIPFKFIELIHDDVKQRNKRKYPIYKTLHQFESYSELRGFTDTLKSINYTGFQQIEYISDGIYECINSDENKVQCRGIVVNRKIIFSKEISTINLHPPTFRLHDMNLKFSDIGNVEVYNAEEDVIGNPGVKVIALKVEYRKPEEVLSIDLPSIYFDKNELYLELANYTCIDFIDFVSRTNNSQYIFNVNDKDFIISYLNELEVTPNMTVYGETYEQFILICESLKINNGNILAYLSVVRYHLPMLTTATIAGFTFNDDWAETKLLELMSDLLIQFINTEQELQNMLKMCLLMNITLGIPYYRVVDRSSLCPSNCYMTITEFCLFYTRLYKRGHDTELYECSKFSQSFITFLIESIIHGYIKKSSKNVFTGSVYLHKKKSLTIHILGRLFDCHNVISRDLLLFNDIIYCITYNDVCNESTINGHKWSSDKGVIVYPNYNRVWWVMNITLMNYFILASKYRKNKNDSQISDGIWDLTGRKVKDTPVLFDRYIRSNSYGMADYIYAISDNKERIREIIYGIPSMIKTILYDIFPQEKEKMIKTKKFLYMALRRYLIDTNLVKHIIDIAINSQVVFMINY